MNKINFSMFGSSEQRVKIAIKSLKENRGIIVIDSKNRENESDILFVAKTMTVEQMAFTIRYGSGIVCLCLTEKHRKKLKLPMMVKKNTSKWGTGFTVTIEAAEGITTGVSASDRLTTIKTAIKKNVQPSDLNYPGHVFPLRSHSGGVLLRAGHTEAAIDLIKLAGFNPPLGVICELTNDNGSMKSRMDAILFAKKYDLSVVTIKDLIDYLKLKTYNVN